MPNRILRDWTDSDKFDGLSAESERLFLRLIMKADDYGRFHANPRLVKSACFPLAEDLRANTVAAWLTELSDRHLVFCYTSGTGQYLAIINFRQRLKQSVPKFPPAPGKDANWMPDDNEFRAVPGTSRNFPLESETETEAETKYGGGGGAPLPPLSKKIAGPTPESGPERPPIPPGIETSLGEDAAADREALMRALGKLQISDEDLIVWQALKKALCTLSDVEAARKRRKKNRLSWLQDSVCEERDARTKKGKSNHELSGKDYLAGLPPDANA